jgi:hypothetical protein
MTITVATDVIDRQILTDAVQGRFAQKNALIGSALTSSGAISVEGTFPGQGKDVIGQQVEVPYFGTLPAFVNNPDGSSIVPSKLGMASELGTVTRSSLAFQASRWARASGNADPYAEAARQAEVQATRRMEELIIASAATSPLLVDLSSAGSDVLTYDALVWALAEALGEDFVAGAAIVAHPLTLAGLATQRDAAGNLQLTNAADGGVTRLFGIPVIGSGRTPKTTSTMGAVTSTGTNPPVMSITGVPLDAFKRLVVECQVGGAHETATIRFSTDGGVTWSANLTTAGVGEALALTDTANDSLVGVNGATGLSVAFAAGAFNADNVWSAYTDFVTETQVYLPGAGAFWYNRAALAMKADEDILDDSTIGAMHLYGVAHTYRRRQAGHTPGVVRIRHRVKGYRGVAA